MTMKRIIIAAFAAVVLATTAQAQNFGGGQRQRMNPTEMYTRTAERMAERMKLDADKANLFKVLYLDYQMARQNAMHPKGEQESERVDMDKLTDEKATELIEKQFAGQEAQLAVDKDYLPKFLEILTPAQAAQVYLRGGMGMMGGGQGRQGGRQGGSGGPR